MLFRSDFNLAVGGDFNVQVSGKITQESTGDYSAKTAGNMMHYSVGSLNLLADDNVNVDGAEFHGQEGAAMEAPSPTLPIDPPDQGSAVPNAFQPLTTPVRPSPPVQLKYTINEENTVLTNDYVNNPDKYKNPTASENGVKIGRAHV